MTDAAVVHTDLPTGGEAGSALGSQILDGLSGESPDALIVFASPKYDYVALLEALDTTCRPQVLVGCSSAGEFTSHTPRESSACAVAIRSSAMKFAAGLGRGLRSDSSAAAQELVKSFGGPDSPGYAFRSAMILTDALAGYADNLIEQVTLMTAGTYQLFGGGAGDDAQFQRTHVFYGTEAVADAAVALEILSNKPIGIGVRHGWKPSGPPMRVTESEGMRLVSLNATPVLEVFQEHADSTGQAFDRRDPLPFFLHNVLGIETHGGYRLRVPLEVNSDGSVSCAADIPTGSTLCIMNATAASAVQAATDAAQMALDQLAGARPKVAIFFDCVATRLRTGQDFGLELRSLENLGLNRFAGCNTYGQIARSEGQFGGFHNCTAVVSVFPE